MTHGQKLLHGNSALRRKGAVRRADVTPALLRQLNAGAVEALTLSEVLVIDFHKLMKNTFPDLGDAHLTAMRAASSLGWVERTRQAGRLLHAGLGLKGMERTLGHASDQVRGWGAALLAAAPRMTLEERLNRVRPFADDPNAGVRETAWLMLRPFVAADVRESLRALKPFVREDSANLRRFASEITRPRGVWCAHIRGLREHPALGLPLLTPLRADPSRYVQNSVANWLNDASKDDPDFVRAVTTDWQRGTPPPATAYICRRAQRTLNKK